MYKFLLIIFIVCEINCQEYIMSHVGPCVISKVRQYYKVVYYPLNNEVRDADTLYIPDNSCVLSFNLNGLRIDEKAYKEGELYDVTEEKSKENKYNIIYEKNDSLLSVKEVLLYSKLDAPVILNGEEIEEERIEETLSKIRQEDIISIKKTGGFLRKTRLEIVTK